MVKQWVQPPINKNRLPRGGFLFPISQVLFLSFTSSAAQGGGGSFKSRKPIGEVGCCASRMAGRSH